MHTLFLLLFKLPLHSFEVQFKINKIRKVKKQVQYCYIKCKLVAMQVQPLPARKKNIVELHERLLCLLKELEPWEPKLLQATRNARIRLRRELEDFEEPPDQV